jgi:hypothetical protein
MVKTLECVGSSEAAIMMYLALTSMVQAFLGLVWTKFLHILTRFQLQILVVLGFLGFFYYNGGIAVGEPFPDYLMGML